MERNSASDDFDHWPSSSLNEVAIVGDVRYETDDAAPDEDDDEDEDEMEKSSGSSSSNIS